MIVPYEFGVLVGALYYGSFDECSSLQEWAAGAVARSHDRELRDISEKFLESFLADHPSVKRMQEMWLSCHPTYYLGDKEIQEFLPLLLTELKKRREEEDADEGK